MKLVATIVLIMSFSAFSKDHPADCEEVCHQELRGSSGTSDIFKFASMKFGASEDIAQLAVNICAQYYGDATKVAENVKGVIVRFLIAKKKDENPNLKHVPPPSPEEIIKFLNKHKNQMLCGNTNYMVKAFEELAYHQLFNVFLYDDLLVEELILRDDPLYVDINAISYTGPPTGDKPETVLDFMLREVKDPMLPELSRKKVQYLIDMFKQYYGGKRYAQLPKEEKTILLVSE